MNSARAEKGGYAGHESQGAASGRAVSELVAAAELQAGLVDVLARLGAQTPLQRALEEDVTRLPSLSRDDGPLAVVRNGRRWRPGASAVGPLRVAIPRLRHEDGIFPPVVESVRRVTREILKDVDVVSLILEVLYAGIPRAGRAIFGAPSPRQARREAAFVWERPRKPFPGAMECPQKDLDPLLVPMRCPRPLSSLRQKVSGGKRELVTG